MELARRSVPFEVSVRTDQRPDVEILYRTLTINNATSRSPQAAPIRAHLLRSDDVFIGYSTDRDHGLKSAIAKEKSRRGLNVLSPPKTNYTKKFMSYMFGGFNSLMWVACVLSIVSYVPLGGPDAPFFSLGVAVLLMIVIAVSTFFYAYVDWNASRIMKSIQSLIAQQATVVRDGQEQRINADQLVIGDVVVLAMGQRVPADVRLIEVSSDLKFDRSLLTGESAAVSGTVDPTSDNPLETKNIALASTFVLRGSARGVVIQIGDSTVIGQILKLSGKQKESKTPIQTELDQFTLIISIVAASSFAIAMLVWATWIRHAYPGFATASAAIINAVGCLTSFVPQGLPICFALALTIIARRMAARHVLVKNLSTVETLGCMSVLCSDKTGTLTVGHMAVHSAMFLDCTVPVSEPGSDQQVADVRQFRSAMQALHMIASLCNDARFLPGSERLPLYKREINGDATDSAILQYAEQHRTLFPSLAPYSTLFTMAFNSKKKFMAKVVRCSDDAPILLVKGAPDILLKACSSVLTSNGTKIELDEGKRAQVDGIQKNASDEGLRVLALCQRSLSNTAPPFGNQDALEEFVVNELHGLTLVGLLALRDPPRLDTLGAVQTIRRAGVRVFMVTGDFELTACAIARQVGIITAECLYRVCDLEQLQFEKPLPLKIPQHDLRPGCDEPTRAIVINGSELDGLHDRDWDFIAARFSEMVFARTTPEQKLLIVEHLRQRGDNVVAVTGDGTNDAPALKAADIGVAMGAGSDVAKEAAAMILLNNDFSSLTIGIENGRLVFENLKKVIMYLLPAGNYCQCVAVLSNVFFGMPLPLSSFLQVLFSVSNDLVMSISLMFETSESDLMERPPRNARTDRLSDWRFFIQVYLVIGPIIWLGSMLMWFLYMAENGIHIRHLLFAYDRWVEGWADKTVIELSRHVSVGQCCYFVCMAICQFGTLLAIRNRSVSQWDSNPFWGPRRNLVIPVTMTASAAICVLTLYVPWLQSLFGTATIPFQFWLIPIVFALTIVVIDEVRKTLVRAFPKSELVRVFSW